MLSFSSPPQLGNTSILLPTLPEGEPTWQGAMCGWGEQHQTNILSRNSKEGNAGLRLRGRQLRDPDRLITDCGHVPSCLTLQSLSPFLRVCPCLPMLMGGSFTLSTNIY